MVRGMHLRHYVIGGFNMNIGELLIKESTPTPQEYILLRKSLQWEIYSESAVTQALQNSLYGVSIYLNNQIIGTGRVVGDAKLCFYIQDVMVAPNAQHQGIGRIIMKYIMSYIYSIAVDGAYIGLMSKKGKEAFYENFGFVKRPNSSMGCGMVIPRIN